MHEGKFEKKIARQNINNFNSKMKYNYEMVTKNKCV